MVGGVSSSIGSSFWYYIGYLDPRYLPDLYNVVVKYMWRSPQDSIEMDVVNGGKFVSSRQITYVPEEKSKESSIQNPFPRITIPLHILDLEERELFDIV